jgi:hypothetical protein
VIISSFAASIQLALTLPEMEMFSRIVDGQSPAVHEFPVAYDQEL